MINKRSRMREEIASIDTRSNKEKYGTDEILAENEEWAILPPVVEGMFKKFDRIAESTERPSRSRLHESASRNRRVREMGRYAMEPQYDSRKSFGRKAHVITSDDDSRSIKCESYNGELMKSLVTLAVNDRELQQVINAFQKVYGEKATDMILDDEKLEATFMNVMDSVVKVIQEDDKRLGQPGFEPDIEWYLGEVAKDDETGEVQELFDSLLKPVKDEIDREAERVDDPEYAIDSYGIYLCETQNWRIKNDVNKLFDTGRTFGFSKVEDFIEAAKECSPTIDAYNAGSMGWDAYDVEEDCHTLNDMFRVNAEFLGNGEEEIQIEALGEYSDIIDNLPDNVKTHYDDNAYVKGDCIYVTSNLLVHADIRLNDILEKGIEMGFVDKDYQFIAT